MKTSVIIAAVVVFIAFTVIVWLVNKVDEDVGNMCFFFYYLFCVVIVLFGPVFVSFVEEKGLYRYDGKVKVLHSAPLHPFLSLSDSVWVGVRVDEYGGRTYYFSTDKDSTLIMKKDWQCDVRYFEDDTEPYYELVSTEARPLAKKIFKSRNEHLQPRYVLHVKSGSIKVISSKASEWDSYYSPPY